jgi:large subunit ribosomal protein L30e
MDIKREIKEVTQKGRLLLGKSTTLKAIKNKKAKLIILSANCPAKAQIITASESEKIPLYQFEGDSIEFGSACGKPFGVSVMAILDPGETSILQLSKELVKWRK